MHPQHEMQCHVLARSLIFAVTQGNNLQANGMFARAFPAYWMPPYTLGDGSLKLVNAVAVREACGIVIQHTNYMTLFDFNARAIWRAFEHFTWEQQERTVEILKEYYDKRHTS